MGDERGTRVYVGNLTDKVKKEQLDEEFSRFGKLNSVWIAHNPPGFAFIEFANKNEAESACDSLNGQELLGSKLRVEISKGRSRQSGGRGGGRGGGGRFGDRPGGGRPGGGFGRSNSGGGGFRSNDRPPRSFDGGSRGGGFRGGDRSFGGGSGGRPGGNGGGPRRDGGGFRAGGGGGGFRDRSRSPHDRRF